MKTTVKSNRKAKIKQIEGLLRHYKSYKVGIKNIEQQLDWIMPGVTASYSDAEGSSGTFNISSKVENAVLDRMESKQALDLHEEKELYQHIVSSIDLAYDSLDHTEQQFLNERYMKKKSIPGVAAVLGYHEKYLHQIRNNLMDKLLISLSNILKLG